MHYNSSIRLSCTIRILNSRHNVQRIKYNGLSCRIKKKKTKNFLRFVHVKNNDECVHVRHSAVVADYRGIYICICNRAQYFIIHEIDFIIRATVKANLTLKSCLFLSASIISESVVEL